MPLQNIQELGIAAYGDIIMPFTKLIKIKKDLTDVERINEVWMTLNRVEGKPTVAYIAISQSVLWNDALVLDIRNYIARLNADVLIIKVKNIHLTDGSAHAKPRESMQGILESIALKKKNHPELLTIALECGEHLYPFAIQAFDVVSCSASMFDREVDGGNADAGYGGALDEETLGKPDFHEWQKAFRRLGYFPCSHEMCQKTITTMDEEKYLNRIWWTDARRHNILTINGWLQMIAEAVSNQTADLAVDRLRNSPIRVLTELLIRNYEDPTDNL